MNLLLMAVIAVIVWILYTLTGTKIVCAIFLMAVGIASSVYCIRTMCRETSSKSVCLLFFGWLCAFILLTLVRVPGSREEVRLIPFKKIINDLMNHNKEELIHFILNMLLFVPSGVLNGLCLRGKTNYITNAVTLSLCLSLSVECIQLIAGMGICDINDLLANTLGCLLGAVAIKFILHYIIERQ